MVGLIAPVINNNSDVQDFPEARNQGGGFRDNSRGRIQLRERAEGLPRDGVDSGTTKVASGTTRGNSGTTRVNSGTTR
eukprot:2070044-Pyramimonas_sp.AAC.1